MRSRRLLTVLLAAGLAVTATPTPAVASPGSGGSAVRLAQLVPAPASVLPQRGQFQITRATAIHADRDAAPVANYLAGVLRPSTGYRLPVVRGAHRPTHGIVLSLRGAAPRVGPEGYQLDVSARTVVIRATTPAGLFAGVQTLRQLLPAAVEAKRRQSGPWLVPAARILDQPRFAYRGAMLDVSRHFFSVREVKRYIDQIAQYKVNRLHLHLADDQGWRIEIAGWPRLTSHGGSTEVGGTPGGFYTKRDYAELVAYARSRYITIVPEIDMPGHTNAALASYAELNCNGIAPPLYTGTDVGFSSLCVSKEITYKFLDDVIRQLAAITPGQYLHIGGDEAHATTEPDFLAFMARLLPIVAKYGKKVSGWHEFVKAQPVASAVPQFWGTDNTEPLVVAAAARGNKVLMSPANKIYLDMKYDENTPIGQDWAALIEVADAYGWDPGNYLQDVPTRSILGVEAPLWTETITNSRDIEFMAFPRLPAVAELGWSPVATHDWASFRLRLAAQGPRWAVQGVNFYRSPQIPWPR
jgi:hexosaminidase